MRKRILVLLCAGLLAVGMVGCGSSGNDEPESKVATEESKQDDSKEAESDVETEENVSKEPESEPEESATGNPLMDAELVVGDVKNGTGTEIIGEYAYIEVDLDTMKTVTMEQYDEFCDKVVTDSGYNWITIDFGNGSGLQFQGSTAAVATYGTIDGEGCIKEQKGIVMMKDDVTYEYTAF